MAEYSKGLGQLLSDSFMLFFKNFDRIVTVVAAVHLPLAVLHVIFFTNVDVEHILASQRVVAMVPFFARSILYVAITLTGVLLYHVALIKTIESIDTNAPLELANAYRQARTLLLPYMLVWFLGIVRIAGWFLLLVAPGVLFAIYYSCANMALILDNQRGMAALVQSKKVVRFRIGKFVGNMSVAMILTVPFHLFIQFLVGFVFGVRVEGNVGLIPTAGQAVGNFFGAVIAAFAMVFGYFLYQELKRQMGAPCVSNVAATPVQQEL